MNARVKAEAKREVERAKARIRMRTLRAKTGGLTPSDRARNTATSTLIHKHRDEFDRLYRAALYREKRSK